MRRSLLLAVLALTLTVPASAAQVNPKKLVLQEIDVPPRYLLEQDNSGLLLGSTPEARRQAARIGYVTGYYATYRNTWGPYWRTIKSHAFVFRNADIARKWIEANDRGDRFIPADLGDQGWVATTGNSTVVHWRHGRVAAVLACELVVRHRAVALALARKQQQRIAAALR